MLLLPLILASAAMLQPARAADQLGPSARTPSFTISKAEFCLAAGFADQLPGQECKWQPTALAKLWKPPEPLQQSDAWFKLHFDLIEMPKHTLAMYMVAFNRSGRLFVNGQALSEIGAMTDP